MMVGSVGVGFGSSRLLSEYSVLSCWLGSKVVALKEGSGILLAEVEEVENGLALQRILHATQIVFNSKY